MASAVKQHHAGGPLLQLTYMSSRNMPYLVLERVSRHMCINNKAHLYMYTYIYTYIEYVCISVCE